MVRIEWAAKEIESGIRDLLIANDLPVTDITSQTAFLVAQADRELLGCVAMERLGEIALLRSLAVTQQYRSRGIGKLLCNALLQQMQQEKISRVYLLTTTAAGFFDRLGFERIPREQAPEEIRNTEQFRSLCPSNAVVMRKDLERRLV